MTRRRSLTSRETKRLTILHFWNNGERSPTTISRITKISLGTVKYNIVKIKQQGTTEERPRSGRPRKLNPNDNKALGQWIRRNNETTAKELMEKLLGHRRVNVSKWTVQRQLKRLGYKNSLPYGTPMLTQYSKKMHVFNGQSVIRKMTGVELFLQMKHATSYLETRFVDGQKIQKLKLNGFQKIGRRLWYGVVLVLRV